MKKWMNLVTVEKILELKLMLSFFNAQSYVRLFGELKSLGVANSARRWFRL